MASSLSHLLLLKPASNLPSAQNVFFLGTPQPIASRPHCRPFFRRRLPTKIPFAITESGSPKSLDPDPKSLLQELAETFVLPADYFSKLPRDLRLDLHRKVVNFVLLDAPKRLFGYQYRKCGEELGEILLNISRAWELAEASTSAALASKLPVMVDSLTDGNKSALGKRLISAGRRFQSMGKYGQGKPEMIAKVMIRAGKFLSATAVSTVTSAEPKLETRTLKFGELQVELTPDKAYIGAVIGLLFGTLSWGLSQGIESVPESSLQYANDNALLLPKSLRGALLALCYSSTLLSAFASVGLLVLGVQLGSKEK